MLTRTIGLVVIVALPIEIFRAPIDEEGYIKVPELISRLVSLASLIAIIPEDISPFIITNLTYLLVLLRLFLI